MARKTKEVDRWQIEHDLNTLVEAEKIRSDKKRFTAAQALAKERLAAVAGIASEKSDK